MEHRPLKENPGLRVGEQRGELCPGPFGIFRGHEVAGSLVKHLLGRITKDLPAFRADVGEPKGLVDVQDQVADVLDEAPEEQFALAQGLFRPALLGDILEYDGDSRRPVVEDGGEELGTEEEFPVVPQEAELLGDLAAVQGIGDPAPYQRVVERRKR